MRAEYSPRHVPDKIIQVQAIPATLTGKKMEVPVRKLLLGVPVEQAANVNAMANPDSLAEFATTPARSRTTRSAERDGGGRAGGKERLCRTP